MSEFFLNEHSLYGQYTTLNDFLSALRLVLGARQSIEDIGSRLYCDTRIRLRPVIAATTFEQAVRSFGSRELISSILSWLSKTGPFWSTARVHSPDDLFGCNNDDVTDSALAEAACRHRADTPSNVFSFSSAQWNYTPVSIVWTRSGGEVDVVLDNFWALATLGAHLTSTAAPVGSWPEVLKWAAHSCKRLVLSKNVIEPILHEPFSFAAAAEIQMLLGILDQVSANHDASGALNEHGHELLRLHFQGHHARFTDETPTPEFYFNHPVSGDAILCSWHGKVRLGRQYRIHFQWPKPQGELLWVSYIGPKLTKW